MLTKKEREEIAERFRNYDKAEYITLYSGMYDGLLGEHVPKETTVKKDRMELASRVLDLCDTSNMVELPVDKDGEVIRIGDTVYDKDGEEYKVTGYKTLFKDTNIALSNGSEVAYTEKYPHKLTHKRPVTIESLVARIKRVMNDDSTTVWAYDELNDIADQLESLGDSDD